MKKQKTVVAGALGECVHVAGVVNFLRLAEMTGWRTIFLGPAVSIKEFLKAAVDEKAELIGVSYRLTPETGERLLADFAEEAAELHAAGVRFAFGGTPPVAERAKAIEFFERVFDGSEPVESVLDYLKMSETAVRKERSYPKNVIDRIEWKSPFPLFRHHFGLPSLPDTISGIEQIAESQSLDVISLGIDQDAQENFFHPEKQNPRKRGAGGVPVRSPDDYRALFQACQRGNFPLLRTYSGTDDFLKLAEMYLETIQNAWCAIPIFWFNQMDGRGPWDLEGSIREHQKVIAWYGERNIPVEINEPHHWGLRDAPDVIFVVAAYLSAYQAKKLGARDYIAQLMFNCPPGLSDAMDLAKMQAVLEIIQPLAGANFRIWRQSRTGLLSYPVDLAASRAHLSTSVYLQSAIRPHIIHIVGFTEAHHAAEADEVIEASRMARRTVETSFRGIPNMLSDPTIQNRKNWLIEQSKITLDAICEISPPDVSDPLIDPGTLARAVETGILDAPHLAGNLFAKGQIRSKIVDGACVAVDEKGHPLDERKRLEQIRKR